MKYHLAQVNIAQMLASHDSPVMAEFFANVDRINQLAENSPGFIWRLKDDENSQNTPPVFDDNFLLVNLTVWANKQALFDFTYQSLHVEIFKRKKEWFHNMSKMHMALWFVPENHIPTLDEASQRLNYLRKNGPTPYAFLFKNEFSSLDASNFEPKIKEA